MNADQLREERKGAGRREMCDVHLAEPDLIALLVCSAPPGHVHSTLCLERQTFRL